MTIPTHLTRGFEPALYAAWESSGAFSPRPGGGHFSILLPPPNITGRLHMGHAYEHTLIDATARLARMQGKDTLFLPGLDHAALATNALLERRLREDGLTKEDLGREEFTALAWRWKEECEGEITSQMRTLGTSPAWERLTFTLDPAPARATHILFTRLYEDGLIYRSTRPTQYCPTCQTSLSDIETETGPEGAQSCSRCTTPTLSSTTPQWFLRTAALAALARRALESGETRIDPPELAEEYLRWIESMHDWCLSRQIWWGERIPLWHRDGQTCSFLPGEDIPEGWEQDPDTLDTWFSSGIWPLSTLGWPEHSPDLEKHYPFSLLITGSDLLFFWALRMMMLCTYATGRAPFERILFHGMIRDEQGQKISKSKGNALDPLDLLSEHSPDALRLALAHRSRPGADIAFGSTDIASATSSLRKLWSIARLAQSLGASWGGATSSHLLDRWLLARLDAARAAAEEALSRGHLALGADALLRFMHEDLSELYLEARKDALYTGDAPALSALSLALSELLALLHPLIPFTTDHLARALGAPALLDLTPWPTPREADPEAEQAGEDLRRALLAIRSYRATSHFPPGILLPARIQGLALAGELSRLAHLTEGDPGRGAREMGLPGMEILLPPPPSLSPAEEARLEKRLGETRSRLARTQERLASPLFQERATPEAIAASTAALTRLSAEEASLLARLGR